MINCKINPLISIKNIVRNDLELMDKIVKDLLFDKDQLIQKITHHIISSGGKRLRPILTILSAKLFNHSGSNRHINLAAVVEFIHTATLLHDDVVDHSKLRRGQPTANKTWGNKESILVGDFLLSQAFLLMAKDSDINIIEILSRAACIIAEGEVIQLNSIANIDQDIDTYLKIISAKTAELFAASCQVGTAIAVEEKDIQHTMYEFGLNLGMAFQIIDDILDYVSNNQALGKNPGDDFKEGKTTLPVIIAYANSNAKEKEFWQRCIANKIQKEEDFDYARSIMNKYEVIPKCKTVAINFVEKAKNYINLAPNNHIKTLLIDLLNFSISREF